MGLLPPMSLFTVLNRLYIVFVHKEVDRWVSITATGNEGTQSRGAWQLNGHQTIPQYKSYNFASARQIVGWFAGPSVCLCSYMYPSTSQLIG